MFTKLQGLLPQRGIAYLANLLANCKIVWLKNRLIQYFLWRYPVNLAEALNPEPYSYASFNDFFTRALNPVFRPIAQGLHDLVSPVDGEISQVGAINTHEIFQAKGKSFTTTALLGGNNDRASAFEDGSFATLYLAPKDYHRVHMPMDGTLTQMIYIPGDLFSVNPKTAQNIDALFARNERLVTLFDTSIGEIAIVLVGAMIVGSIETVFGGTMSPPPQKTVQTFHFDHPIHLKRGEELGRFKLGSTVIVLFPKNTVVWDPATSANTSVKFGQRLGIFGKGVKYN